jgi:alpha-1,2-mannosyltransferase
VTTDTTQDNTNTTTNNITPWVRRGGPAIAAIALVTYIAAYVHWPTLRMQVDLMVYRFAAEHLLAGLDLYSTGLTGNHTELLFIYPPFAAICATPLALLDSTTVQWLWLFGMVAALAGPLSASPRCLSA